MTPAPRRTIVVAALVCVTFYVYGKFLDRARALQPSKIDAVLQVPAVPSEVVDLLTLGFSSAAADVSYLEAIQVFGAKRHRVGSVETRVRSSRAIYQLLDYATDLDPLFAYAYVFGALAIPVVSPNGYVFGADDTAHLLKKGISAVETDWRIPFNLSYIESAHRGQYGLAAEAMAEAAQRPGHPKYLPYLVSRLAAHSDRIEIGIELARAMADNAENEEQRRAMNERVNLLVMESHIRRISQAVQRFLAEEGRLPSDVGELLASHYLATFPREPHGGRYLLDQITGAVKSDSAERLRLPKLVLEEINKVRQARSALPGRPSTSEDYLERFDQDLKRPKAPYRPVSTNPLEPQRTPAPSVPPAQNVPEKATDSTPSPGDPTP